MLTSWSIHCHLPIGAGLLLFVRRKALVHPPKLLSSNLALQQRSMLASRSFCIKASTVHESRLHQRMVGIGLSRPLDCAIHSEVSHDAVHDSKIESWSSCKAKWWRRSALKLWWKRLGLQGADRFSAPRNQRPSAESEAARLDSPIASYACVDMCVHGREIDINCFWMARSDRIKVTSSVATIELRASQSSG
jgi:hypothetical protein